MNAMSAVEMSQMVVQAMWDRDSPLKQIPHFNNERISAANDMGIKDVNEFIDAMDPSENKDHHKLTERLGMGQEHLKDAASFVNKYYPNVELTAEPDDTEIMAGVPAHLNITIDRQLEEDEEPASEVHAPFFPADKSETWYLVVAEEATKTLLAIKRVTLGKSLTLRLEYTVPTAGQKELTCFLMSDSYVGVDQAPTFAVTVAEGDDDNEEENEDEE